MIQSLSIKPLLDSFSLLMTKFFAASKTSVSFLMTKFSVSFFLVKLSKHANWEIVVHAHTIEQTSVKFHEHSMDGEIWGGSGHISQDILFRSIKKTSSYFVFGIQAQTFDLRVLWYCLLTRSTSHSKKNELWHRVTETDSYLLFHWFQKASIEVILSIVDGDRMHFYSWEQWERNFRSFAQFRRTWSISVYSQDYAQNFTFDFGSVWFTFQQDHRTKKYHDDNPKLDLSCRVYSFLGRFVTPSKHEEERAVLNMSWETP